jgi:hypothetical protein
MKALLAFYAAHGTKILASVQFVVLGIPEIPDLVEPGHMKWWKAANLVIAGFQFNRGFTNNRVAAKE